MRDTATGESASIDLAAWLARQTGTSPAPNRLSSITEPLIDFTLGERRHRLVIELATFDTLDDKTHKIGLFAGTLFAQP